MIKNKIIEPEFVGPRLNTFRQTKHAPQQRPISFFRKKYINSVSHRYIHALRVLIRLPKFNSESCWRSVLKLCNKSLSKDMEIFYFPLQVAQLFDVMVLVEIELTRECGTLDVSFSRVTNSWKCHKTGDAISCQLDLNWHQTAIQVKKANCLFVAPMKSALAEVRELYLYFLYFCILKSEWHIQVGVTTKYLSLRCEEVQGCTTPT